MFYYGKYIDLFEHAMQMLFLKKGYGIISHLDAMGRRCFGFRNNRDEKGYYIPVTDTQEALKTIAHYTHLKEKLTAWYPNRVEDILEYAFEGILYGPIEREIAIPRIRNLYYHGENRYVYIQADSNNRYSITDPDGFPMVFYSKKEIHSLFCNENGTIIRLQRNDGINRQIENAETIWEDGWEFQRKTAHDSAETTLCPESFREYDGSASSHIALRYGVANFAQHMEKIWRLKEELDRTKNDCFFRELLCDMMEIAESGEVDKLPQIEAAIWKELSDEI